MRFARYQTRSQPPRYGWVDEDHIGPLDGTPFGEFHRNEANLPLEAVTFLAPVEPGKIICVDRNYKENNPVHGDEAPAGPVISLKPSSAVIGHMAEIILPPQSQQVEHEAELVVVIGRAGRWITPEQALDHILGYTIGNDVTARDLQHLDEQWTRSKGFDTFCPVGPWIETDLDLTDTMITCHVNDGLRQMASTRDMVFNIRQLIAFISSVMTLLPGDMIMTGTPAGASALQAGDRVKITIDGLGVLENPVILPPSRYGII
jgi:2-keto-4-pentenoate hydratase/2-oxohepta-3-ene-1,7-dioic acid hydratase in catechol pathway